jgi:hypothetical protein
MKTLVTFIKFHRVIQMVSCDQIGDYHWLNCHELLMNLRNIYQKLDTNSCYAKLRAISNLFSFLYTTLYIYTGCMYKKKGNRTSARYCT